MYLLDELLKTMFLSVTLKYYLLNAYFMLNSMMCVLQK